MQNIKYCAFYVYNFERKKHTQFGRARFFQCLRQLCTIFFPIWFFSHTTNVPKLKIKTRQRLINETLFVSFCYPPPLSSAFGFNVIFLCSLCDRDTAKKNVHHSAELVRPSLYLHSRWFCIISLK